MASIVISERFGGFGLSGAALERLRELGWAGKYDSDVERTDPRLLQVLGEMGADAASGGFASLVVVDVPDDVKWHIHEYDGFESIHEDHRTWGSDGTEGNC